MIALSLIGFVVLLFLSIYLTFVTFAVWVSQSWGGIARTDVLIAAVVTACAWWLTIHLCPFTILLSRTIQ